jgi:GNAT superfamily N-acetyltransferase
MSDRSWVIEPLVRHHDRHSFKSSNAALDTYLKRQAHQDVKRRICQVYVLTTKDSPNSILGYYTLSSCAINLTDLPDQLSRKLPRHPVPTALLGRLAIAQSEQGSGLGQMLLANAVKRTLAVADEIGIYALMVDAIDEGARAFYLRFGFSPLQQNGRRLFLPLKSI